MINFISMNPGTAHTTFSCLTKCRWSMPTPVSPFSLAIPFSMLMSFSILQALGITLNMVVLFSLTLALGMLVDNAIVIVENIYRYLEQGAGRIEAAMRAWLMEGLKKHGVTLSEERCEELLVADIKLNTQGIEFWLDHGRG